MINYNGLKLGITPEEFLVMVCEDDFQYGNLSVVSHGNTKDFLYNGTIICTVDTKQKTGVIPANGSPEHEQLQKAQDKFYSIFREQKLYDIVDKR